MEYNGVYNYNATVDYNASSLQDRSVSFPPLVTGTNVSSLSGCYKELGHEVIWVNGTAANQANLDISRISKTVNSVQSRFYVVLNSRYMFEVAFFLRYYLENRGTGALKQVDANHTRFSITWRTIVPEG